MVPFSRMYRGTLGSQPKGTDTNRATLCHKAPKHFAFRERTTAKPLPTGNRDNDSETPLVWISVRATEPKSQRKYWSAQEAGFRRFQKEHPKVRLFARFVEEDLSEDHGHMCSKSFLRKSWSWSSSFSFQKEIFRGPWPYVPEGFLEVILVMVIVFFFCTLCAQKCTFVGDWFFTTTGAHARAAQHR